MESGRAKALPMPCNWSSGTRAAQPPIVVAFDTTAHGIDGRADGCGRGQLHVLTSATHAEAVDLDGDLFAMAYGVQSKPAS